MSKKLKVVIGILSFILMFNLTTDLSQASSKSTSAIIKELKAEIKDLKSKIKMKDFQLKLNNKTINNQIAKNDKLKKEYDDLIYYNINQADSFIKKTITSQMESMSTLYASRYKFEITIYTDSFYFPNFEKHISDKKLKEIVTTSVINNYQRYNNIKIETVTIKLENRDLVVKIPEK